MMTVALPERATQDRIIALFTGRLGYRYLGNWIDRVDNRNVERDILAAWLAKRGYGQDHINRAIYALCSEADNFGRKRYDTFSSPSTTTASAPSSTATFPTGGSFEIA